jgi:hypothetical protein
MSERVSTGSEVSPERLYAFDELRGRLESLTRRAETLGFEVSAVVEQSGQLIHKHADEPVFGASLGKLPLAVMAIESLEAHVPLRVDDIHGIDEGVTPAELVTLMLGRSDNLSYRVLAEALGGPDAINDFYDQKGWHATKVKTAANGRAQLAETTASEALKQLQYILGPEADNDLSDVARTALSEQQVTRYGIRQLKLNDPSVHIFNKTGEYPGDYHDPYVFRHDVGSIMGPSGRVSYALMTSIAHDNILPTPLKQFLADGTLKRFGSELITYVGGNSKRDLGARAVTSVVGRS